MNWDDYRFILAIDRKGNLTKAAESLGVNQTTVSRRLRALQKALGVQLFEKLTHGFVLTQEGEEVIQIAEGIEQRLLALEARVGNKDRSLSGSLHITFSEIIGTNWNWAFAAFAKSYPNIDLILSLNNTKISVMQREADIAIRYGNNPPENLVGRKLGHIEYALYAAHNLTKIYGEAQPYDTYPWVTWAPHCSATLTEKWMRQHAPYAKSIYAVDTMALMQEAIGRGDGIGFLPCSHGDKDSRLKRIRDTEKGFGLDMWILTHPDRRYVARIQTFMDYFAMIFSSNT